MIPGWKTEIENEYLQVLRESPRATPADFTARLGQSEGYAVYWLAELAKQGRIRILAVELVEGYSVSQLPTALPGSPIWPLHHLLALSSKTEGTARSMAYDVICACGWTAEAKTEEEAQQRALCHRLETGPQHSSG